MGVNLYVPLLKGKQKYHVFNVLIRQGEKARYRCELEQRIRLATLDHLRLDLPYSALDLEFYWYCDDGIEPPLQYDSGQIFLESIFCNNLQPFQDGYRPVY